MKDKLRFAGNATIIECLLKRIQRNVDRHRTQYSPADDAASKSIDDERHVIESAPDGDAGQIGYPQAIRCADDKVAIDAIQRHIIRCRQPGRLDLLAERDARDAHLGH